jgi:hypothetical protein
MALPDRGSRIRKIGPRQGVSGVSGGRAGRGGVKLRAWAGVAENFLGNLAVSRPRSTALPSTACEPCTAHDGSEIALYRNPHLIRTLLHRNPETGENGQVSTQCIGSQQASGVRAFDRRLPGHQYSAGQQARFLTGWDSQPRGGRRANAGSRKFPQECRSQRICAGSIAAWFHTSSLAGGPGYFCTHEHNSPPLDVRNSLVFSDKLIRQHQPFHARDYDEVKFSRDAISPQRSYILSWPRSLAGLQKYIFNRWCSKGFKTSARLRLLYLRNGVEMPRLMRCSGGCMARRSGWGVADVRHIVRLEIRQEHVKDSSTGETHQQIIVSLLDLENHEPYTLAHGIGFDSLQDAFTALGEKLADRYEEELAEAVTDRDAAQTKKRRA